MKTLHWYLMRQVLATLCMTVVVFTFVLLLGNGLKDIMALVINRQATIGGVLEAMGLLIPWVLVFALPMGMLTAALLVFGRFSADQELTAVRSSGISLVALITPILMLSLALCGLSAWINLQVGPQCRVAFKNMLVEMGLKIGNAALPEGRFVKDFSPYIFYIGRNDGQNLHSILLSHLGADHEVDQTITADRGKFEIINGKTTVTLYEAHELHRDENGTWGPGFGGKMTLQFSPDQSRGGDKKPSLSDMTFGQLRTELRELESSFSISNPGKLNVDELKRQKKLMEQVKTDLTMPARVQIHRQIATSFACLGFTLVGIPLGIRAHRRETNIGIAMALALVLVYYSFLILGQSLQTRAEFAPYLIMWLPNFIFQSAGMVMLWRANKGI